MFDAEKFAMDIEDKDPDEIREMYRKVLIDFIISTRNDMDSLLRNRSVALSAYENAERSISRRKAKKVAKEWGSLFKRITTVILYWENMTQKFDVSISDISEKIGVPKEASFHTIFPEVYELSNSSRW